MITAAATPSRMQLFDAVERIVIVGIYVFLLYRFTDNLADNPTNLVYLIAEGVVMLMVLCRRSTDQISARPADWAIAFGGTFIGMMMMPASPLPGAASIAPAAMMLGLGVSLAAKLQLRRSFGIVAANRGLKTSGVYGLVRHPMYLGYVLINGGMLAMNLTAWNAAVVIVWLVLQVMRIAAEERLLARDAQYAAHMTRVRYRLLPGVY